MIPPFRIAAIPGDGIGKEVLPEGLRVLNAAAERFGFALELREIEWANCDYYVAHGRMMPDDWKEQLAGFDAIYFGAVGWPATVPDHISLWGSLLKFRREFVEELGATRLVHGYAGDAAAVVAVPTGATDPETTEARVVAQAPAVHLFSRSSGRSLRSR